MIRPSRAPAIFFFLNLRDTKEETREENEGNVGHRDFLLSSIFYLARRNQEMGKGGGM